MPLPYPDTYYARSLTETTARPALVGVVEADCIVVGAGLAGLITALELARGGLKPVVIEARAVGWGLPRVFVKILKNGAAPPAHHE